MSRLVKIKDIYIGNGESIKIQSMTNTKTKDVEATVSQILDLENEGCEIIRVSVPDHESAHAIKAIKDQIHIPLVADIHFDYKLAIESIENGVDKIRFNPGNIGDENRVKMVVDALKAHQIPVRIGVNSGSIETEYKRLAIPDAMVKSALKHVKLVEKYGYHNIVLSVKASSVENTIKAYRLLSKEVDYPLHLGVTEAGVYEDSIVKSSIGIGSLLVDGIGDTIRVSITGDPVLEVKVAKDILKAINKYNRPFVEIVSCPTCARTEIPIVNLATKLKESVRNIEKNIKIAVMGCVVNGPGEAKNADFGIAGGKDKSVIFSKGKVLKTCSNDNELINELIKLLKDY